VFHRIRQLFVNLAIYGLGDLATSIVSFLLLPLYVRFLSPADYGVIGLLLTVEVVAKILFRWGVDASFMRLYYDCTDGPARQRLASTIFFFLFAVNGALLAAALLLAPAIARHAFGSAAHTLVLRLVLVNTFLGSFYFLPFHVLRIEGKPPQFIALTVTRSAATLVGRLVLIVGAGLGVLGFVLADLAVTALFTLVLLRWFAPLIRPMFSRSLLRDALRFGLPRLPHGVAHQTIAVADRYLLSLFGTLRDVGLYSIGASFGMAMKLFLTAFEYAWAPFYFAVMKEPDARRTFSGVTTYALAALVLLAAGLSAVAEDIVRLMTTPEFQAAAQVIPWIALGVLLQGVYLLTSIGLNITKRTQYYPMATGIAAATSIGTNLLLIPRFGVLGAAWSNVISYAVLAAVSLWFSQRLYPIRYEYGRVVRVALAGIAAAAAGRLVPIAGHPLALVLLRSVVVLAAFPAVLAATGFFEAHELQRLRRFYTRLRPAAGVEPLATVTEAAGEIVASDGAEADAPGAGAILDGAGSEGAAARPAERAIRPALERP
jgi:O-antigen/teichoic acid export membrane protein